MYCHKCMSEIPDGSNFCPVCSAELTTGAPNHTSNAYIPPVNQQYNNAPNSYQQQNNYYQQQSYNNPNNYQPQGYNNQQAYNQPKKPQCGKNYTVLIIVISVCLVALLACAALVVFIFFGDNIGKIDAKKFNFGIPDSTIVAEDIIADENASVDMINCLSINYADAKKQLEELGLIVKTEYKFDNYYAKDIVCDQSAKPGDKLNKGDTVTICVSKGTDINPNGYDQKVVVSANAGASSGKLKLYNWENGEWKEDFSCVAMVGSQGISSTYGEGLSTTPKGTFKLGYLIAPSNFGSADWPFYKATGNTCVVDDQYSSLYNQIKEVSSLPSGTEYDQIGKQITNGNCSGYLFIEHNGNGRSSAGVVKGNGSAITICGMNGRLSSTYGCIDISSTDFYTLVSKLDYSKNPHIELVN